MLMGGQAFHLQLLQRTSPFNNIPLILHDHYGIQLNSTIPFWFTLYGRFFMDQYIGVYERHAEWATKAGIQKGKISIIPNGINLDGFNVEANIQEHLLEENIQGVMVCGIRLEKGLDLLIRAVSNSSFKNKMKINVVGDVKDKKYFSSCLDLIEALRLTTIFNFIGERGDVAAILQQMDFALMPSRSESGPLVMIEYLASGLPIVAFELGSITAQARKCGVPGIVPPGDITAFTQELDGVFQLSAIEREERGKFSRNIAEENFDIRLQMPKWYQIYDKAVLGRRRNPLPLVSEK